MIRKAGLELSQRLRVMVQRAAQKSIERTGPGRLVALAIAWEDSLSARSLVETDYGHCCIRAYGSSGKVASDSNRVRKGMLLLDKLAAVGKLSVGSSFAKPLKLQRGFDVDDRCCWRTT